MATQDNNEFKLAVRDIAYHATFLPNPYGIFISSIQYLKSLLGVKIIYRSSSLFRMGEETGGFTGR